jgi:hypothetical protein
MTMMTRHTLPYEPGIFCSVCVTVGWETPASVCLTVDGGCIVITNEHQHLCAQHFLTVEPIGPNGVQNGPCGHPYPAHKNTKNDSPHTPTKPSHTCASIKPCQTHGQSHTNTHSTTGNNSNQGGCSESTVNEDASTVTSKPSQTPAATPGSNASEAPHNANNQEHSGQKKSTPPASKTPTKKKQQPNKTTQMQQDTKKQSPQETKPSPQEAFELILDTVAKHKSDAVARGFTTQTAEAMATTLHYALVAAYFDNDPNDP